MNFSFLNPLFCLGAVALAAPVWLHLRRKNESNQLKFSVVRFLEDQPAPRRDPFRLRDVLLFIIRALAMLLVVGGFAWPYQRKGGELTIKESRVYILDNTMSHQANKGFEHDRDEILAGIAKAGHDTQIAAIELTGQPHVIGSFGDDRGVIADRVRGLSPSFERGSYLAAFQQANTLLINSLGERKEIVLYGDNQENQWSENASSPPFLRDIEVVTPRVSATSLANLSLSEPRLQRIFLGDKSLVNLTMDLAHTGEAREATVSVRINGQEILNRVIALDKEPGSISLQAQMEADPSLWLRGEANVAGAPDVLPADNRLFFSLAPLKEGRVVALAQSTYLRSALSPDVMRGQWSTRILEPTRIASELDGTEDADVLAIESNYLQMADARRLVHRYLDDGRGVLLMVNRLTPAVSGCLLEFGFEPEAEPATTDAMVERIKFVVGNHPIFQPFVSSDFGNLTEVKFFKYARLKSANALPLVLSDSGNGLLFQSPASRGKLFVTAFGFDRDQTSWPVHQTFIPFLDLTLQAARAEDPTPVNYEPGAAALIQMPPDSTAHEVVLRDAQRELARAPVSQSRAQLRLPGTPGLYDVTYDADTNIQRVFSVNPSPKESQLAYVQNPPAITNWQINTKSETVKPSEGAVSAGVNLAGIWRQRLWWWMVVLGFAALVLETLLAIERKNRA